LSENNPQNGKIVVGHHYKFIDGLRGVAVLLVIWFHASELLYEALGYDAYGFDTYYRITILGQFGVDLFFLISGFLITAILIDTAYSERKFKNFYIRRSLRIFPLYYLFFAIFTFMILFSGQTMFDLKLLYYFFFIQNWSLLHEVNLYGLLNHTWSLAVEEQFYLIWPCLFWFMYKKSYKATFLMCITFVCLSWVLRWFLANLGYNKFAYTMTFSHMDGLILGGMIALLYKKWGLGISKYKYAYLVTFWIILIILLFLLFNYNTIFEAHIFAMGNALSFVSIIYCSLLLYLLSLNKEHWVIKILCTKSITTIGRISYGLYIFHVPICIILSHVIFYLGYTYLFGHIILFFFTLALSYFCAHSSYTYFEKPILKFKDKWAPLK